VCVCVCVRVCMRVYDCRVCACVRVDGVCTRMSVHVCVYLSMLVRVLWRVYVYV